MVSDTCKSDTFICILIKHSADRHMAGSSVDVISWTHQCTTKKCFIFVVLRKRVFNQLGAAWREKSLFNFNTHIIVLCFSLSIQLFWSASTMPSNATGFTTNANVSGIAESRVPAHQPAQISPVHVSTSRRMKVFSASRRIAGTDISACCREATALSVSDLLTSVVLGVPLLLINKVSFRSQLSCILTTFVLRIPLKIVLYTF